MIVDNNVTIAEELVKNLSNHSYEIMAFFANGIDLLSNINYYDPDILLVGLDGYEIVKKLNYYGEEIKLVAVASCDSEICVDTLKQAGFRGFILRSDPAKKMCRILDTVMEDRIGFDIIN